MFIVQCSIVSDGGASRIVSDKCRAEGASEND
jgi:hypothetical protein